MYNELTSLTQTSSSRIPSFKATHTKEKLRFPFADCCRARYYVSRSSEAHALKYLFLKRKDRVGVGGLSRGFRRVLL